MWEAINNAFAPCAFNFTARVDPKDQVAKREMPVPADRIDQQGDVWKPLEPRGGGKWVVGRSGACKAARAQTAAIVIPD